MPTTAEAAAREAMAARADYLTPEHSTPDEIIAIDRVETARENVERLARRIADYAPARQGTNVHRAGVAWDLIREQRAAVAELDQARAVLRSIYQQRSNARAAGRSAARHHYVAERALRSALTAKRKAEQP